ncbi:MAG TPA: hypothetical protein VJT54_08085 [Verrucomicrobiae bacterium]|nr:hypothetical protein [Verrucomicrobiae bacterium]
MPGRPLQPVTGGNLWTNLHFETESIIYNGNPGRQDVSPFGETDMPQVNQPRNKSKIMGDRSPKSNRKKSNQKQAQANSADRIKKQAIADKQTANKKK